MEPTIKEPSRTLPVHGSYEVVVAGGGIAGVAAAVAAARAGASVCLLDKESALGGLATLGNVTIWLPICDGRGRQVIGGLGEELLKLSVADLALARPHARFAGVPACWQPDGDPEQRGKRRYQAEFNPSAYLLALEQLVVAAGVKLLYDTRLCAVRQQAGRLTHLIVENKSGRFAIAAGTAVDATGDADLCFLAGEATESLDSNVACGWFYTLHQDDFRLQPMSSKYSPTASREDAVGPFFRGDDGDQVTEQILASRQLLRTRLAKLRDSHPGEDIQVLLPPAIACLRMTRRLVADFSLGRQHMHQWFPDTVGLTGDWRQAGPVYALPLPALRAVKNCNLITAGRCISADTSVWDVTRAIPTCAVTGEAAGTAAALAAHTTAGNLHHLDVPRLQDILRQQGGLLDKELVAPLDGIER